MDKEKTEKVKEKEKESKGKESKERTIVVPGEVIVSGPKYLPGENTRREADDIIAMKFGLLEKKDNLIKVIPLSGAYTPRVGNVIIGQVIDVMFNGWLVDVLAPQNAFLSISECSGRINRRDLTDYYTFGDNIVAKIKSVKSRSIDLTMKGQGLRKLKEGIIIRINPSRVPRIIGRAGSMIKTIKEGTGCNITVGQNGLVWIKGRDAESELLAKEAISLIIRKPFIDGLTERVKEFLEKNKNKTK